MPERAARPVRARRLVRLTVALALTGAIAAACGASAGSPGASRTPDAAPARPATPHATSAPGTDPGGIVVDAALLRVLPASVGGAAMLASPDSASGMIGDPSLALAASAIAVGVVVAPRTSGTDDLAIASVIQLRPGVYREDFSAAWREAYDRSACEPAGGVASHAQQLIGTHTVELTVCGQGARIYHTHLPGDRLVSITSVGDGMFGDLVMAGLRQ